MYYIEIWWHREIVKSPRFVIYYAAFETVTSFSLVNLFNVLATFLFQILDPFATTHS